MFGNDVGEDAAAYVELGGEAHVAGLGGGHQVIQNLVGDGFVEGAFVAVGPHVELEALEFDTELVRDVVQDQGGEVGLAGLGAEAGEFGNFHVDVEIPAGGVGEGFQGLAGLGGHGDFAVMGLKR